VDLPFTAHMEDDLDKIAAGERNWVAVLRDFYGPFARALEAAERSMEKVELKPEDAAAGLVCEKCGSPMVVKNGRFGKFIACSNYPQCRNAKPYVIKTGAKCPECGGDLLERRTRKRRIFYGCANYPTCKFSVWQRPVPQSCKACGGLLTEAGKNKLKCVECQGVFEKEEESERRA
jgi:DNA topoisomerase-1